MFIGDLAIKHVMLLLLAPVLCRTSKEQLRWHFVSAFLLSRGADSSSDSGFETETQNKDFLAF